MTAVVLLRQMLHDDMDVGGPRVLYRRQQIPQHQVGGDLKRPAAAVAVTTAAAATHTAPERAAPHPTPRQAATSVAAAAHTALEQHWTALGPKRRQQADCPRPTCGLADARTGRQVDWSTRSSAT